MVLLLSLLWPVGVRLFGMKLAATKRKPEMFLAFRYCASSVPLIQGAPSNSNGISVPLPTETLVPSTSATPGYNVASVRRRRLGDGFTHANPVESYQSPRIHPSMGTTVSLALILRSTLNILASSPMVMP